MADYGYDRRQGHRGGGNRKRRFRDDDDFDRRPQRRRYEEPAHVKIRKRLLSIAESSFRDVGDDIQELGRLLCDERVNEEAQRIFREILLQMLVEQPLKIPFLAAIMLVVNTHDSALAGELIVAAVQSTQEYINEGAWRQAKLVLRFLACCQGILEGDGVFPVLDELFARAVDLQTASSEDGMGLEFVKIILLTVAYAMASSATGFEERAAGILEKTDIVATAPHVFEALVNPYSADPSAPPVSSIIRLLSVQLQAEAKNEWPLACIPRPWKYGSATEGLEGSTKHPLPSIQIPEAVTPSARPCLPEVYLSVYSTQDFVTVPPTTNVASSIIRDSIVDTIDALHFNRNIAAQALIDIDRYFTPDTFAKRATPFDKLKDIEDGMSKWKPEDVAVDAVFSQLLRLPTPPQKLVYYHSVLTEVCKLAPAAIAPSLGRAIRYLYKGIDVMDLELCYRFMDWFAHHLSNFGFTWKWIEWVDDVELPPTDPRKSFIIGALDKEIRLSVAQRIRGTLPEPYQVLVGPEKEKDTPDFKYDNEGEPYADAAKELCKLIRTRAPDAEMQELLITIQDAALAQGVVDPIVTSADVLATCLCHTGSKSLSHLLSCIERTKERLLAVGPASEAARRQLAQSVLEYWHDRPGTGVAIIDKLLNYGALTPLAVVELIFSPGFLRAGAPLAEPHVFELFERVLTKVCARLRQVVDARTSPDSTAAQRADLDPTLEKERAHVKQLFALADDALGAVAEGSIDAAVESDLDPDAADRIKAWGRRWLRVTRRMVAVETTWAEETLAAAPPPKEELMEVEADNAPEQDADTGNGAEANGIDMEVV